MMTQEEKNALINVITSVLELGVVEDVLYENLCIDIILMLESCQDWYKIKQAPQNHTPTEQLENYREQLKKVVIIE